MNAVKQCKDRFADIVAFVMGELEPEAARELQEHIALCDSCRSAYDVLVEEEKDIQLGFEAFASRLGTIKQVVLEQQHHPSRVRTDVYDNHFLERIKNMILAHKQVSVAAAVVTALAASLILYVSLVSSSTAAYALDQTAQANNYVVSYHVIISPAVLKSHDVTSGLGEAWVQVRSDGTPLRARMDYPKTEDGAKVVIVSADKAEVWLKDKNSHIFIPEKDALNMVMKMRYVADPKLLFAELQAKKETGKAQVATKEPTQEGGPITLTVTYKDAPDKRQVCEIDPKTKLLRRVTTYRRQDGKWEQVELREFLDYNKEIDPKVFQLDLSKGITTINQIKQKPGLVKGDLTDEEIAKKVVREFFEALIAEDYEKAGLILEGMPAAKMKELFGRFKFLRIVEIGEPVRGKHPDKQALQVPAKVEWEISDQGITKPLSLTIHSTDAEMSRKTARDYFEALIAQDYKRADRISQTTGLVLQGATVEAMKDAKKLLNKENGEHLRVVHIVEIGKPVPKVNSGSMEVPVKIEFKMELSNPRQVHEFSPFVRPPHGQPHRRVICGGI